MTYTHTLTIACAVRGTAGVRVRLDGPSGFYSVSFDYNNLFEIFKDGTRMTSKVSGSNASLTKAIVGWAAKKMTLKIYRQIDR